MRARSSSGSGTRHSLRLRGAEHAQAAVTAVDVNRGEIAVLGLGKSGAAAASSSRAEGARVYMSDSGTAPWPRGHAAAARGYWAAVDTGATRPRAHPARRRRSWSAPVFHPNARPSPPHAKPARRGGRDRSGARLSDVTHIIAITGTNGKTTMTALSATFCRGLGKAQWLPATSGARLSTSR